MKELKTMFCNAGLMEGRIAKVYAYGIDICEKLKLNGLKTACVKHWGKHIGNAANLTLAALACMPYSESIDAIKKGGFTNGDES